MNGHEHDDALAELLRRTMRDEADGVMPAGDGLSRIRTKAAVRRRRMLWLRPAVALGSAAAVAAVSFGAYALVNNSSGTDSIKVPVGDGSVTPTPHRSVSPTPTATPTQAPPQFTHFPKLALWPVTDTGGFHALTPADRAHDANPRQVAAEWIAALGYSDVNTVLSTNLAVDNSTADVTLGRFSTDMGRTVPVTVVHLANYRGIWVATGATDAAAQLTMAAPAAGSAVPDPVTVSGPGFGNEELVTVNVVDIGFASDAYGRSLGAGSQMFGNGTPQWSVPVRYQAGTGGAVAIVATEKSPADGGISTIVVERVESTPSTNSAPAYFYSIKDGRVTKFSTRNGQSLTYLTNPQPGGGVSDPQVNATGDLVYYLQANGPCTNALMSIHTDGSDNSHGSVVAPTRAGSVISGYAVSPDGTEAAMWESGCAHGGKLVLRNLHTGTETVLDHYPSSPPMVLGDPVFAPDAQSVYAFLREGNFGSVQRYAVSDGSRTEACPGEQAAPDARIDVGSDGVLYIAEQSGNGIDLIECGAGLTQPTTVESLHTSGAASDIDVAGSGDILIADSSGHVWRGSVELHPSQRLTTATW